MKGLEKELKHLIVDSLILEDVTADQIDSDAPLFVEGLGLDSVDALELGMALARKYGVKVRPEDENNRDVFRSIKSLAEFIEKNRTKQEEAP